MTRVAPWTYTPCRRSRRLSQFALRMVLIHLCKFLDKIHLIESKEMADVMKSIFDFAFTGAKHAEESRYIPSRGII